MSASDRGAQLDPRSTSNGARSDRHRRRRGTSAAPRTQWRPRRRVVHWRARCGARAVGLEDLRRAQGAHSCRRPGSADRRSAGEGARRIGRPAHPWSRRARRQRRSRPKASAYRWRLDRRTSPSPLSRRATADCEVPILAATSVCDKPSRCRTCTRSATISRRRVGQLVEPREHRAHLTDGISYLRYRVRRLLRPP